MRHLASVRKISEIKAHPNADSLELAIVDGWQCVVAKGEFSSGDLIVYFEIDSVLPIKEEFEFLRSRCYVKRDWLGEGFRLKTIRLRQELSQGLIMPISIIPSDFHIVGTDVTDVIGVVKWDPPLPACLSGQAQGNFPSFIPKTDQKRIQNLANEVNAAFERNDIFEITIKLDGSSCTVFFKDGDIGICSRNLQLKYNEENKNNSFIRAAEDCNLVDALKKFGRNIAIQAELMGPSIQGNKENLSQVELYIFDIFDIDEQRYLTMVERYIVIDQLVKNKFTGNHVPIVAIRHLPFGSVTELLKFAEGPSLNAAEREGLVFKHINGGFSFKAISNAFLLKTKE